MIADNRYLSLKDAAQYLGQSLRWMRRHYVDLIRAGVRVYRVPRDAVKGRLLFRRDDLDNYLKLCQISQDPQHQRNYDNA